MDGRTDIQTDGRTYGWMDGWMNGRMDGWMDEWMNAWMDAISDRPLRSLVRNDLLVPRSRTSTSKQCAFASAGPLLWNCLPVKTRAQILSTSLSSTPRILKSFLFPGAYRTGGRL